MIAFYHDEEIDMWRLGCTLLNMADICSHKSTDAKLYPITERNKNLLKKIWKMFLVVQLSFLHEKQLLVNFLFEYQQT